MLESLKQQIVNEIYEEAKKYETRYFLTLNALTRDQISFETNLGKLSHRLNKYCYGRSYIKRKKRLRILGYIEQGELNLGLHIHLIVMHNNDTKRSFEDINTYIRKNWYWLIKARGTSFGNLVDLQLVREIKNVLRYITKTFYSNQREFSPLYF